MELNIIINKRIYENYKEDILPLSARLFCDPYFYELKTYSHPFDLKGIQTYLKFTRNVILHTTSTFIDFVNILLVLSFLKENGYNNQVTINYYMLNQKSLDKALFISLKQSSNDYNNVDELLNNIKNDKTINNNNLINLPGLINFINFYNLLIDKEKFLLVFEEIIEQNDENIDRIANYLYEKYSNMGLDLNFYINHLTNIL